jgi:hypothetical protein
VFFLGVFNAFKAVAVFFRTYLFRSGTGSGAKADGKKDDAKKQFIEDKRVAEKPRSRLSCLFPPDPPDCGPDSRKQGFCGYIL